MLKVLSFLKERLIMSEMDRIVLGKEYKDEISGFTGIAVTKTEWINGCVRVTLSPKLDKDGKFQDSVCLDAEQLVETGHAIAVKPKDVGGDRIATSREPHVRAVGT